MYYLKRIKGRALFGFNQMWIKPPRVLSIWESKRCTKIMGMSKRLKIQSSVPKVIHYEVTLTHQARKIPLNPDLQSISWEWKLFILIQITLIPTAGQGYLSYGIIRSICKL